MQELWLRDRCEVPVVLSPECGAFQSNNVDSVLIRCRRTSLNHKNARVCELLAQSGRDRVASCASAYDNLASTGLVPGRHNVRRSISYEVVTVCVSMFSSLFGKCNGFANRQRKCKKSSGRNAT